MRPVWTSEQTAFLKANYATMKTAELLATLTDKTNDQLRWKAKEFRLHKQVTHSKVDMTWLERFDDPETCYWWGFITADGCINERSLIISIHERDEAHLQRFCTRAGTRISRSTKQNNPWHPGPYTMVRTALADRFTLARLKTALSIQKRKTYNPLDVSVFCTPQRLAYYMAGLIDGDGHIAISDNNVCIRIKVHPNWTEPFRLLASKLHELYGILASVKFTKDGWVYIEINRMRHVVRLYNLIDGKVPYMERKWKPIDPIRAHCTASNDGRIGKIGPNPSANLGQSSLTNQLAV